MATVPPQWLNKAPRTHNGRYRHEHYIESPEHWDLFSDEIIEYFQSAHADARSHLATLAGISLHPAGELPPPIEEYPCGLPHVTLQGYFGEVFAAYLAETFSAAGHSDWEVPAHLFRCHLQAFQFLEQRSQSGHGPSAIVGRTGDDCVAFRRNDDGEIVAILYCEAKCTTSHDAALIRDAHEKLSASEIVDVLRLVEVLRDSRRPDAGDWITSLQLLYVRLHAPDSPSHERHDLVCYVHQSVPRRRTTWINTDQAHEAYTASRSLDIFEVRLVNVSERLLSIYSREIW